MKRLRLPLPFLATLAFLMISAPTLSAQDLPGCTLPFDGIKVMHAIDSSCGSEGLTQSDANKAQNRAKNNFCATGDPVFVTFDTFLKLQRAAEQQGVPFGSGLHLPDGRSVLANLVTVGSGAKIGEGTVVRLVAYVVDAHNSNVSKGESVNCKQGGKENNDIHIALGSDSASALCDTITAEMSPHFRPAAWDQLPEIGLTNPVRITGQLFFDASHKPCKNGKGPNPQRESLWEIHPLYAIDVCSNTTLEACSATDDSVWTPLDAWLSTPEGKNTERELRAHPSR